MHGVGGMDMALLLSFLGYRSLGRAGVVGVAMRSVSFSKRGCMEAEEGGWRRMVGEMC
jgi:hypothetical protein